MTDYAGEECGDQMRGASVGGDCLMTNIQQMCQRSIIMSGSSRHNDLALSPFLRRPVSRTGDWRGFCDFVKSATCLESMRRTRNNIRKNTRKITEFDSAFLDGRYQLFSFFVFPSIKEIFLSYRHIPPLLQVPSALFQPCQCCRTVAGWSLI